jgi:hypothetical protein
MNLHCQSFDIVATDKYVNIDWQKCFTCLGSLGGVATNKIVKLYFNWQRLLAKLFHAMKMLPYLPLGDATQIKSSLSCVISPRVAKASKESVLCHCY